MVLIEAEIYRGPDYLIISIRAPISLRSRVGIC